MQIELSVLISIVSVVFAVTIGVINVRRNKTKDDKSEAHQAATLNVRLESIEDGISEIKSDIKNIIAETKENRERIIKVEESSKQAHRRLDNIENRRTHN